MLTRKAVADCARMDKDTRCRLYQSQLKTSSAAQLEQRWRHWTWILIAVHERVSTDIASPYAVSEYCMNSRRAVRDNCELSRRGLENSVSYSMWTLG